MVTKSPKTKRPNKDQRTLVTFLLDRSGSMASILSATLEAFNAYLNGLRGNPIDFSLVLFDSISLDKIHVEENIDKVPELTDRTYEPRGTTPLIDAAVKTIRAVEASLAKKANQPKVVVAIQTDGAENCSSEHTWAELNALIKEKTKAGWHFLFMGASIDAYQQQTMYAQAALMGIGAASTVAYNSHNREATLSSFAASGTNTSNLARGRTLDVQFTSLQKQASGDVTDLQSNRLPQTKKPIVKPIVEDFGL